MMSISILLFLLRSARMSSQEGLLRDFVREIQALRKEAKVGLSEVIDIEVPALQLHLAEKAKVQGRIGKIAMGDVLRVV